MVTVELKRVAPLNEFDQCIEQRGGARSIDEAMVSGKREIGNRSYDYLAGLDHRDLAASAAEARTTAGKAKIEAVY